jgi:hypothetical protein
MFVCLSVCQCMMPTTVVLTLLYSCNVVARTLNSQVLRGRLHVITMFVIADVGTSIWLVNYRDAVAMYWLRSFFRSIYALSMCLAAKNIVMDWTVDSLAR